MDKTKLALPLRLRRLITWIIGAIFFIGGILKLMDPTGATLVMDEYFKFFHITFMAPTAQFFAVTFALIETILGTALITGVWRRIVGWITLGVISFFTLITLLLVIFNPTMDCGCFGEAIHLTHVQTFTKNIVILILYLMAFYPIGKMGKPRKVKYVSFSIVSLSVIFFMIYSLLRLPLIDFTDFKPGAVIAAAEKSWTNINTEPEYTFIYEKNGQQEKFSLANLPDSTWTFVESRLNNTEDSPNKIVAPYLSFTDEAGTYCDSLAAEGPIIMISVYQPEKLKTKHWDKIYNVVHESYSNGLTPMLLVAATSEQMHQIFADPTQYIGMTDIIYYSDYKTLITLNRSNGGYTYLEDGIIIKKWSHQQGLKLDSIQALAQNDAEESLITEKTSSNIKFQGFLLYTFAIMLLL